MPKTRSEVASLYPRLGLSTIDSTALRYDPSDPRFPVCFVMTDGEGVKIAWDICGACLTYVGICGCKGGPQEPAYIYQLRTGEKMPDNLKKPLSFGTSPAGGSSRLSAEAQARVDARTKEIVERAKAEAFVPERSKRHVPRTRPERVATEPRAPKPVLTMPCARHTAESRDNGDGTFTCTVAGCEGVD